MDLILLLTGMHDRNRLIQFLEVGSFAATSPCALLRAIRNACAPQRDYSEIRLIHLTHQGTNMEKTQDRMTWMFYPRRLLNQDIRGTTTQTLI